MPVFTYKCDVCGAERDVWVQPVRDNDALTMDLPCLSPAEGDEMCDLKRIPSAPAVIIPAKHRAA
jgi:predicted nucleic acid-binding Zn ribbon protein